MDVLVDTSVWSLAVRRRLPDLKHRANIDGLIAEARIGIIGAIRQECLSGVDDSNTFARLRNFFRTFNDIPHVSDDYELAASFFNTCRSKGLQGSHIDFLICAVAHRLRLSIYTTDRDFDRYAKHIPVRRFKP